MNALELRTLQAPLKQKYREDPNSGRVLARAEVELEPAQLAAKITGPRLQFAGLHPAAGGTGTEACSADMLLEALAACAGVTLMAVATSSSANLTGGRIIAQGIWDARGTLGVDKTAKMGIQDISLSFELEGDLDEATRTRLVELTERYCVILATLRDPPTLNISR